MELLLIRHALPVRVDPVLDTAEPADPGLSEIGHRQSALLADYLHTEEVHALYSSPLTRARQTAAALAEPLGLNTTVIDDLAEWDRNAPDYVPIEELKAAGDPRWTALVNGQWEGDEPPELFHQRVRGAIEMLIGAHRGERVIAVCHGGVINSYLAHVLGIGNHGNGFFYPDYTSIHRVAAASSGERSVVTINETAHLRAARLGSGIRGR